MKVLTDRSQSEIIDIVGQQLWWEIREYKNINEVGSLDTLFMSHLDEKVLSEIDICSRERQLPEVILNAIATALFIKESISMYAEPAGLSPRLEIRVDGVAVILQLDDRELEDTIFIGGLKDEDDDGDVFDKISDYLSV